MLRRCARALSCAVLVAALMGAGPSTASADDAGCALGDQPVSRLTEVGAGFVAICLVNAERTARGLEPLAFSRRLALAGDAYAQAMIAGRFFSHDGSAGDSPADRVLAQDYVPGEGQWQIGETLAWGNAERSTPRAIVQGWMNSPQHVGVLLDPAFREIGIGVRFGAPVTPVPGGESVTYAAEFGVRSQVVVDGEPAFRTRSAPLTATQRRACRKRARTAKRRARCGRVASPRARPA